MELFRKAGPKPRGIGPSERFQSMHKSGFLLLWAYLASPIVFYMLRNPSHALNDVLWLFNALTTLLWVGFLQFAPWRPLRLHLFMLPLYLATAVDLFLVGVFGNRLSSSYISIMLTEAQEAPELLSAYLWPIIASALLLTGTLAVGLRHIRNAPPLHRTKLMLGCLIALLVVYGAAFGRNMKANATDWQNNLLDVVGKEMSSPVGAVFQFGLTLHSFAQYSEMRAQRSSHSFGARQTAPSADNEIVIWVVGESSRPMNWQLFGYERPTNPLLQKTHGLVLLPDLRTTAATTSYAVTSMFSLRPIDQWDNILAERSVLSAFSEAGFKTWWLSTQEVDNWGGPIPHVAAEASSRRYFERSHDAALIPALREIAMSKGDTHKTFVVVHTKGSHFDFKRRYPAEFDRFKSGKTDRRSVLVDSYDNSILYTDWLLAQIIEILQQSKRKAVLVYASDHGENLLDDDRQLFGHALSTKFDLASAGFLWFSPEMKSLRAQHLKVLDQNAGKPLSISDLPHSMLHFSGIAARGLDLSRSIFSADYKTQPQLFRHRTGELLVTPIQ
jgi:glucan phosphoethanolaminetransferase (alkaline phosphatase superfamily)